MTNRPASTSVGGSTSRLPSCSSRSPCRTGTWCSTDSTGPISPFSILKTSAICQVHGTAGPETTLRPSASVPLRVSPDALSKNANANASPRSGSTATKRRSRIRVT